VNNINHISGSGLIGCVVQDSTVDNIVESSTSHVQCNGPHHTPIPVPPSGSENDTIPPPPYNSPHLKTPTFSPLCDMSGDENYPSTTVLSPISSRNSTPRTKRKPSSECDRSAVKKSESTEDPASASEVSTPSTIPTPRAGSEVLYSSTLSTPRAAASEAPEIPTMSTLHSLSDSNMDAASEFDFVYQFAHKVVSLLSQAKNERVDFFSRFDELNNKLDELMSKVDSLSGKGDEGG